MFNRFYKALLMVVSILSVGGAPVGSTIIHVRGKKEGVVTLPCELEVSKITNIVFISWSENILNCETKECESGRIFKDGNCDIIIKDLRLSDAGIYDLKVYYKNNLTEQQRLIRTYHLYIEAEISAEIGGVLKLDMLLHNADRVEHQTKSSANWMQVWRRNVGVQSDRLKVSDGNLTINAFIASDAGTYRVLDTKGETWITVTVTESKGTPHTDDKHPDEPGHFTVVYGVMCALMIFYCLLLCSILFKLIYNEFKGLMESDPVESHTIIWLKNG